LNRLICAFIALLAAIGAPALAKPQPKGYIQNHNGAQCWYTQDPSADVQYFHKIPSPSYQLTFVDAKCMSGTGLAGEVNKMLTNNAITKAYSHSDARFMTKVGELLRTSALQVRGQCIQSATYPSAGVAVEYQMAGSNIVSVRHAMTVGGCSN